MSILTKIMETVVQFVPDKAVDPLIGNKHGYVGKPVSRVDGQLKVKGEATFAAEFKVENAAHAAIVCAAIAKGKISKIDVSEAEKSNGVLTVITHENAPKMKKPPIFGNGNGAGANDHPPMQSAEILYDGQPIACVVGETLDQAEYAASLIRVEYEEAEFSVSFDAAKADAKTPANVMGEPAEIKVGDAEDALEKSAFKVDNIYKTPRYNHNAIEPHPLIAVWDGDESLNVFDASQFVTGGKETYAAVFGLDKENVRVISPFVGGGFGGKGSIWDYNLLCIAAAKVVKRPVKMVLSRENVFRTVGGRTPSEQRVALGANRTENFPRSSKADSPRRRRTARFRRNNSRFPCGIYINPKIFTSVRKSSISTPCRILLCVRRANQSARSRSNRRLTNSLTN